MCDYTVMFKLTLSLCVTFQILSQTVMCNEAQQQLDPRAEHNKEHLKYDLDGIIGKAPDEMTPEELQFHYFRQHDYDGDNTLDGNELVMSIIHHTKSSSEEGHEQETDAELISMVDDILKFQDKNDDGKITFQEYISLYNNEEVSSKED